MITCQVFFKEKKKSLQLKHFCPAVNGKTLCVSHSSSFKRVKCKEQYVQSESLKNLNQHLAI